MIKRITSASKALLPVGLHTVGAVLVGALVLVGVALEDWRVSVGGGGLVLSAIDCGRLVLVGVGDDVSVMEGRTVAVPTVGVRVMGASADSSIVSTGWVPVSVGKPSPVGVKMLACRWAIEIGGWP